MAREMKDSGIAWIGEMPKEWDVAKLGTLYTNRNEKVSDKDYAPLSVTMKGILPQLETAAKTDDGDNRKLVRKGDFAINSRSDRRGSCGISSYDGSVSLINTILCPRGEMNPSFYNWLFHTTLFADEFYRWGHGIVDDLWTTRWQEMKNINIVVPALSEQQLIANFLDEKCGEIDELVALQEKMIEELKAYKQSVITETVTKSLDKNVKFKDSGVEWIGKIPEHWEIVPVNRISSVVRGASPRPAGDSRYFNGNDVPWITVAEVTKPQGNYIERTETYLTYQGALQSRYVDEGTLLLSNSGATLGVPKITRIKGCINDGSVAFLNLQMEKLFLLYCFSAITQELRKRAEGHGQPNLNTDIVKAIKIPLPTIDEQHSIATYLDEKCSEIDSLISIKQKKIEELKDYKKSLIYEYVTGKKQVG